MPEPSWYDKHISKGNIVSWILLAAAVLGSWRVMEYRLDDHTSRMDTQAVRIERIETLQIQMAEVVLRQQHLRDQTGRLEDRIDNRLSTMQREVEQLRQSVLSLERSRTPGERDG